MSDGRVAIVSGGAQGLGRAIADRFQLERARVVVLDCDSAQGEATARELTSQWPHLAPLRFIRTDLRRPNEIQDAIELVRKEFGQVWALVNNAAVEIGRRFRCLALRAGTIVNISSIQAAHAFPESGVYACTKAALVALTRNLALELGPRRTRVNCISPGYIDTRLLEAHLHHSRNPDLLASPTAALHPLGRRGTPSDVAEAVFFAASDVAAFVNGAELVVDGGLTVRAHWPVE